MAMLPVVVLTASMVTAVPAMARAETMAVAETGAAVVPPPGGLVPSAANFGRTEGAFSVSDDGAARYDLPLWMPEGRGGGKAVPRLSLKYHSRSGNGLVGVGWSLAGLSAITRCPRTIAQDGFTNGVQFTTADAFCLDGNRLVPLSTAPGPEREFRTEQETFARIKALGMSDGIPDSFRVEAKDGTISTFGGTNDALLQAFRLKPGTELNTLVRESTTRVTVAWSLNRVEDRNGNSATVEYERVAGTAAQLWHVESRAKVIRYQPNREVRFSYEDRDDPIESYTVGVHSREPKRLAKVQLLAGPEGGTAELLREYRLSYQNNVITRRSLLTKVTECDGGDGANCLRPLTFEWNTGDQSYQFDEIHTEVRDAGQQPNGSPRDNRILVIDIDGDALPDLLYPSTEQVTRVGERQQWRIRRNNGTGFNPAIPAGFQTPKFLCSEGPGNHCTRPEGQIRLTDHNLDGRTDAIVWVGTNEANPESKQWQLLTSNGTSFVRDPSGLATPIDTGFDPDPVAFADLDGNGAPDVVTAPWDDEPGEGRVFQIDGPWRYRLNNGSGGANSFGQWVDTGRMLPLHAQNFHRTWPLYSSGSVQDVNGDNRTDFTGTDGGWGLNASGGVEDRGPESLSTGNHHDQEGDVNGDGLGDAIDMKTDRCDVQPLPSQLRASLSSGKGSGPYSASPVYWEPLVECINRNEDPSDPPDFVPNPRYDRGVRVVDFNGDGNDDVLVFRFGVPPDASVDTLGVNLYIWRNGQFERSVLSAYAGSPQATSGHAATNVLDFNADGVQDILHVEGDHLRVMVRRNGQVDQLNVIGDLALGGRTEIFYTTLADRAVHTPFTTTYPQAPVNTGGSIVRRHRIATNAGATVTFDTYDHTYRGARTDVQGRGWLGFFDHTVSQLQTGVTVMTEFDNSTRDAGVTSVYPFAHVPLKVAYSVVDRPTIPGGPQPREYRKETLNEHTLVRRGRSYTVEPRSVRVRELERPIGTNSFEIFREAFTRTTYDEFGNADLVESNTTGGRSLKADPTFRNDTSLWLLGLATRTVTTGCTAGNAACGTRVSTADYDDKGNLKVSVVEPDQPAMKLTTTTAYGEFGTVNSVTKTDNAGQSRIERFEYNADRLHATATVNALGHRSTVTTHSGLGVVLDTTDPNGLVTTMKYDRFGRPRETNRSDGSFERINHTFIAGNPVLDSTETTVSGGGGTTVLVDRFGREVERRVKSFDGSFASIRTQYDQFGRVQFVTGPSLNGAPRQATVTDYDRRNRVVSVRAPDLVTVRTEYVKRETHTFDGRGIHGFTVASVDGEVESQFEDDPRSANWLRTGFEYGPFGDPTRIVAPDGTAQAMTYDTLGRRLTLTDPSSGLTTNTYTAFGEVATETDAESNTTAFTYDLLGRIVRETGPDGEARKTYDTAPHGIGKLTNARSADQIVTEYTYDDVSRPKSATWSVGGTRFAVGYGYDALGRQSSLTYPAVPGTTDRLKIAYVYNQHGYLSQIKDAVSGLGPCTDADRTAGLCYWTAETQNADGNLTRERLGNGVVTDKAYLPQTGQLDKTTVTGPGAIGRLGEISFVYDNNRNVIQRNNLVDDRHERYQLDTLNRLTRWQVLTATPPQTAVNAEYTYDVMGNLTNEFVQRVGQPQQVTAYTYGGDGVPPHALRSRDGMTYTYDRAGRQQSGSEGHGRTITYNSNNLPKVMTWAQNQRTEFTYDPDGMRVQKVDNLQKLISIAGLFEVQDPAGSGSTQVHSTNYIAAAGRVVAQVTRVQEQRNGPVIASNTFYLHQDLIGSTSLITNQGGREPDEGENGWQRNLIYDPFGRRLNITYQPLPPAHRGPVRRGFTGHEHDDEFGLIHMKGRTFDPEARRFLTPDPVIANPLSSQAHNRYAYVQNNPSTFTDPTGLWRSDSFYDCSGAQGSSCGDRSSPFFDRGGGWLQGNGQLWNQVSGGATGAQQRSDNGSVDADGFSGYLPDEPGEESAQGNEEGAENSPVTIIQRGETLFWRESDGTYWYLLPSEDSPRQARSLADWQNSMDNARGGEHLWVPTGGEILRAWWAGAKIGAVLAGAGGVVKAIDLIVDAASGDLQYDPTSVMKPGGPGRYQGGGGKIGGGGGKIGGGGGGGGEPNFERMSREASGQGGGRLNASQQRDLARFIGLREVRGAKSHGQPVFTDGSRFYSYDVDGHNGGLFKIAGTVKDLAFKKTRDGTYGLGRSGSGEPWQWYRAGD